MAAIKPKAASSSKLSSENKINTRVWFYSLLLTLQYGAQPLISKRFIRREVIVTSSVLACETAKVICALLLMAIEGSFKKVFKEWTLIGSLTLSGLPAVIYALQNILLQISYKNLDSLTFSMLNQTKLFFTAFFTFILLRQKQSIQQIGALFLLIIAAVLLSIGEGSSKGSSSGNPDEILFCGIVPVLVASVLSGLASALCQWASQVKKRTSYLMTVEMSIVGSLCLLASTYKSPDGEAIRQHGMFYGWTPLTLCINVFLTDPCYVQCCWWNSCRLGDILCWWCSKGICHCVCTPCHSFVAIPLRWETTFIVSPYGSSNRDDQHFSIPKVPISH